MKQPTEHKYLFVSMVTIVVAIFAAAVLFFIQPKSKNDSETTKKGLGRLVLSATGGSNSNEIVTQLKVTAGLDRKVNLVLLTFSYDSRLTVVSCAPGSDFRGLAGDGCIYDAVARTVSLRLQTNNIEGPSGEPVLANIIFNGPKEALSAVKISANPQIAVKNPDGSSTNFPLDTSLDIKI